VDKQYDLLIVGGGLVGASLAAALAPLHAEAVKNRIRSNSKPEKAIPVLFGLEDRGVNPRSSPRSAAVNPFTALFGMVRNG
jgi:hypothetical protein